jgi:signal transduction histidine kinase
LAIVRDGRSLDLELENERLLGELGRSENRFRDIIERNADAIVVIDESGTICFANAVAARMFGKPVEELVGYPFGFPAVAGETSEIDLLRDGAVYVVEMRVVESHWEGKPACIATLRDATDRKRAEESARKLIREQAARQAADDAAQRFRFLAHASARFAANVEFAGILAELPKLCTSELGDWAIVYSIEKGVLRRAAASHRDSDLEGSLGELLHFPADLDALKPVVDVVRAKTPLVVDHVTDGWLDAHVHNAAHRALLVSAGIASLMVLPLVAHDRVLGAVALARKDKARPFDIDDLTLAENLTTRAALALDSARLYQEAREANQVKTDFLAVISHDLRTPLNAIMGYADLLAMGIPDKLSDGAVESVSRIRTSASHLVYLIDQLLLYARLESGHDQPNFAPVEIREVCDDVRAVIEPLASGRGLSFVVDMPDESITLVSDADKLRQVLLNLVSNAVKYSQKGEVKLSASAADDVIHIIVSDTGVGIAAEHLPRIFEPFWQASALQRGPSTGTGLGLSVVRELVTLLGGEIGVTSELGRGSSFSVNLPRHVPGAPIAPA